MPISIPAISEILQVDDDLARADRGRKILQSGWCDSKDNDDEALKRIAPFVRCLLEQTVGLSKVSLEFIKLDDDDAYETETAFPHAAVTKFQSAMALILNEMCCDLGAYRRSLAANQRGKS